MFPPSHLQQRHSSTTETQNRYSIITPVMLIEMPPSPALTHEDKSRSVLSPVEQAMRRVAKSSHSTNATSNISTLSENENDTADAIFASRDPAEKNSKGPVDALHRQSIISLTPSQHEAAMGMVVGSSEINHHSALSSRPYSEFAIMSNFNPPLEADTDGKDDLLSLPNGRRSRTEAASFPLTTRPTGIHKMIRKQAPILTESLEDLSTQLKSKPSRSFGDERLRGEVPVSPTNFSNHSTSIDILFGKSKAQGQDGKRSTQSENILTRTEVLLTPVSVQQQHRLPPRTSADNITMWRSAEGEHAIESDVKQDPDRRWSFYGLRRSVTLKTPSPSHRKLSLSPSEDSRTLSPLVSKSNDFPEEELLADEQGPRRASIVKQFLGTALVPTRKQSLPAFSKSDKSKPQCHYESKVKSPSTAPNHEQERIYTLAPTPPQARESDEHSEASADSSNVVHVTNVEDRNPSCDTFTSEFTLSSRTMRNSNEENHRASTPIPFFSPVSDQSVTSTSAPPPLTHSKSETWAAKPSAFAFGQSRSNIDLAAAIVISRASPSPSHVEWGQSISPHDTFPRSSSGQLHPTQSIRANRNRIADLRTDRNNSVWSTLEAIEAEEKLDELRLQQVQTRSNIWDPSRPNGLLQLSPKMRKENKLKKQLERQIFDARPDRLPTTRELLEVSEMNVFNANGEKVKFGDIVRGENGHKTIVVFIRHWYCPMCGQYVEDIVRNMTKDALERASVDLVVIGCGSPRILAAYRRVLRCPFQMYTDPTLAVYRSLGMTLKTFAKGLEEDKGDYVVMSDAQAGIAVAKRTIKMKQVGMPG